jgi:hypothetical protein
MPSTLEELDLKASSMIEIVDHDPKPYGKVKEAVIFLGGLFYYKSDTVNLVKVTDKAGKKRLFRKNSNLVKEIAPGKFIHKSQAIQTEDGIWLDKNDSSTVVVDGKVTRRDYTVDINGKLYFKSNPNIRVCAMSSTYGLIDDMIKLSIKAYPKERYVNKTHQAHVVDTEHGPILLSDSRLVITAAGDVVYCHRSETDRAEVTTVFHKFRDATNPQLDRIDTALMFTKDVPTHAVNCTEIGHRVHKKHLAAVLKIYNEVILLREANAAAAMKALLKYADDGPDENQAKSVKKILNPFPGKANIYTPNNMEAVISKTTKLTGGLKYTFGVEIETSQGMLPNNAAENLKLKIVGDRSIGAGEYVTGILHGDEGIKLLKQQCDALARCTFVDDKCGIHVHIGGMKDTKNVAEAVFDRHFCINMIKLCCQIEREIYNSCPPSRKPTLKHCHSILRWADINETNWKEYLGAYVFGPEETWSRPWSFTPFKYGSEGHSKRDRVDTWCGGRYKWLNLVHILTKSSFSTAEIRLFAGSTNFDKIYNYVLTSMALVWFAENKPGLIEKGGVTLSQVFEKAFKLNPDLIKRLNDFYSERTKRFADKRGNLYPKEIPKAIF